MLVHEVLDEQGDIVLAVAQGREVDGDDVEPVVEVFAEAAGFDLLRQDLVRGGNHAGVDLDGDGAPDAFELTLL